MTTIAAGTARVAGIVGRAALVVLTLVTPVLLAWFGVRVLAAELAGRQPDGDLEPGGGFALAVLLVELVLLGYVVAGIALAVAWRWVGGRYGAVLAVVALASGVVVLGGIALSWG